MINEFKFDERVEGASGVTLYFTAPSKALAYFGLADKYKGVVATELSLEFPKGNQEPEYTLVMISPTRKVKGGTEDFDWNEVYLKEDAIRELFRLAEEA